MIQTHVGDNLKIVTWMLEKRFMILNYTHFLFKILVFAFILGTISCKYGRKKTDDIDKNKIIVKTIITSANQTEKYLPLLRNKRIAVVANHTSVIFKETENEFTHLVDSLLSLKINVVKVFVPEHGFRGKTLGGKNILDAFDEKTGVQIKSVYGKSRKPSPASLEDIDVILFDIQDVGVRFYTYISTMSNVMEAAAENNVPVIILDRPNPNGHIVDGPMLEIEHKTFVGMHPVPLVYGLTIGEYAKMVNGERWLKNGVQCDITIIPLKNYTHESHYHLPIPPSPNLPNDKSINLYASLGFFEGTIINEGRGTDFQFQRYGAPFFPKTDFSYIPKPNSAYKNPKFEGHLCYGVDLENIKKLNRVDISFLIDAYQKTPRNKEFFTKNFTRLVGNLTLRKQIEEGIKAEEIKKGWQKDIEKFKKVRKKYLMYK